LIEVYADIWCPFAHVGLRSAVARRDALGRPDVVLSVRAWPLELVDGAALDPRATAEHVEDLRAQVAPDLFAHFDPGRFPRSSLAALALAAAAYRRDELTGEAVSLALRDALFEEGRDISDPEVLSALARAHGVGDVGDRDLESVYSQWHEGESRGVRGSPHFFCGKADALCPSLEISEDGEGHLALRKNMEEFEEFLAGCFEEPFTGDHSEP
jgi:predicted DsbA family dithiol-disulfide isomerase